MQKQCTNLSGKRNETYSNDKVVVGSSSSRWTALTEEVLSIFWQTPDSLSQKLLSWHLSKEWIRVALTEVHNQDNLNYDLFHQSEQIMTSSEQSNDVRTVQNSNSSAQQDVLILSMFDQITTQWKDGIGNSKRIMVPDSDETLELSEKSRSKMLLKEQDPIDTSVPPLDPSHSSTTVIVEVPKELPTVSMVNTSLKKLKRQAYDFDEVVKERTTATSHTLRWHVGVEHTKVCVRTTSLGGQNFPKFKMNQVLGENERLLEQAIDKDIVQTVMNLSVNASGEIVPECQKCLELETELVKKKDFVDKETYDKLCNELKAQSQAKDTVIVKLKEQIKSLKGNGEDSSVKLDMDEIETLNIELEHRVTKLVTENEHLKQTYKQLYDSIKPKRVQSKEQCDALIKQVNIKSAEISDLNAKLQEQGLVIAALKNELRKLKGKALDNKETEEALVLRDIVEHVKANYPHDPLLESAVRYTKVIQDLLSHISRSCPSINNCGPQKTEAIPRKKDKQVRFAETLTLTENTKPASTSNIVANKRVLHSTGVRHSTCASGSQPSGNTKNDRIPQPPSSNLKNKVEAHHRNVKTSLNKKNGAVNVKGSAVVQNLKKQDNSDSICVNSNDCMSSDNLCVSNAVNVVKSRAKSKKRKSKKDSWKPTGKVFTQIGYIWRPTGRTFTIVGNACPLTRITTTNEVPSRKPIVLDSESPKPVVKLVYSRKPRKNTNAESVSKTKVVQIVLWYLDSGCSKHMTGDRSQLTNFVSKFLGTVKFGNDQVAKIMGFGDYQIGNVTISRVYYVEGLGHNLFSVGQFCDSNLEVAFRQHTCFIRNLEGVDLLTGSRGDNLYTLSLGNMMASSPICLLSKASKTKSWLWHRRLSHLNFGSINHLARHGLVRGLPKLKFEKDHLCSACALGKSSKKPHKPKSEDTNQEKLYLLHMDLCGPMRVASVSRKKYILVIIDDYSRFTWVKCLRSKDEALAFIINFLKMIQVRLKETV
ncbi:retrovirus-related pol polyprotein from transposon TNT 1-94 [Tanacetum coccineum]